LRQGTPPAFTKAFAKAFFSDVPSVVLQSLILEKLETTCHLFSKATA
jgi:hypothetical protein